MGDKHLSGIKSMFVNSLDCVRVKGGESEGFRIESGVRQGFVTFPYLFNVYMDSVRLGMVRLRVKYLEEGRVDIGWSHVCR